VEQRPSALFEQGFRKDREDLFQALLACPQFTGLPPARFAPKQMGLQEGPLRRGQLVIVEREEFAGRGVTAQAETDQC
jgi:hypothetical protein